MFGKSKKAEYASDNFSKNDSDSIQIVCQKFIGFISRQLDALGLKAGDIDLESAAAAESCRGYIFGLCHYLARMHNIGRDDKAHSVIMVWAFEEVYGLSIGFILLKSTMESHLDGDPHVMSGMIQACKDLNSVLENKKWPNGFAYFASGGAIRPE